MNPNCEWELVYLAKIQTLENLTLKLYGCEE